MTALDAETGSVRWRTEPAFDGHYTATVVQFNDVVVLGDEVGTWAIQVKTGKIAWAREGWTHPVTAHRDLVVLREYLERDQNAQPKFSHRVPRVHFADSITGELRGTLDLLERFRDSLGQAKVYGDCLVYAGTALHGVPLRGQVCDWKKFDPYGPPGDLRFGTESLYYSDDDVIWSMDPLTGEGREVGARTTLGGTYYNGLSIVENSDMVFVATLGRIGGPSGTPTGHLEAFFKDIGGVAWQNAELEPLNVFRIRASEDVVIVQGARVHPQDPEDYVHFLQAFDADSGQSLWDWEAEHIQVFGLAGPRAMVSWYDGHKVNGMTLDSLTGESPL